MIYLINIFHLVTRIHHYSQLNTYSPPFTMIHLFTIIQLFTTIRHDAPINNYSPIHHYSQSFTKPRKQKTAGAVPKPLYNKFLRKGNFDFSLAVAQELCQETSILLSPVR